MLTINKKTRLRGKLYLVIREKNSDWHEKIHCWYKLFFRWF